MFCTGFCKLIEKTFRSCLSMDVIHQIATSPPGGSNKTIIYLIFIVVLF